jgi:hypothetical protein
MRGHFGHRISPRRPRVGMDNPRHRFVVGPPGVARCPYPTPVFETLPTNVLARLPIVRLGLPHEPAGLVAARKNPKAMAAMAIPIRTWRKSVSPLSERASPTPWTTAIAAAIIAISTRYYLSVAAHTL